MDRFAPASPPDLPAGCTNRPVGRAYWAWAANPDSVTDTDERIRLIHHVAVCPACLDLLFARIDGHKPVEPGGGASGG